MKQRLDLVSQIKAALVESVFMHLTSAEHSRESFLRWNDHHAGSRALVGSLLVLLALAVLDLGLETGCALRETALVDEGLRGVGGHQVLDKHRIFPPCQLMSASMACLGVRLAKKKVYRGLEVKSFLAN